MTNAKLYSVWIDGQPSPALSVYDDDGEALRAFRALVLSVRTDIEDGVLEPDCDAKMALYCHGYYQSDGCVRGFVDPKLLMSAVDVQPEIDEDCEVTE